MSGEPTTAAEMAALRQELEQVKNRVGQLEQQRNDAIDALAAATGLTRRQVLGIIGGGAGMGALGVLASGQAQAAASTSDSDGDVGTPSNRADLFTDGINYAMATPNSAETVSEPIIAYDCSVSGFTITLDSSLEPSNGTQVVMLVDQTGNAGSNQMTVTATSNIDGGANITINHDHAVTILIFDTSEWRSTRFIDSVDAGEVAVSGETYVEAHLSSNVSSISSGTFTNIVDTEDTDNRDEFNASQQFSPDSTGKYLVVAHALIDNGSAGDSYLMKLQNVTDGTRVVQTADNDAGASTQIGLVAVEELNSAKSYEVQATNSDSQHRLRGVSDLTNLRISRLFSQP